MTQETSFQFILDTLQDEKKDFPRAYLQSFSDIDPESLKALLDVWPRVKPTRKLFLLDGLLSLLDSDTLVSFDEVAYALINDSSPDVRARAIRLLAESDEPELVDALIEILKNDTDLAPRIEAAHLLGQFVLLGELEELAEDLQHNAEDELLKIASGEEHASLRRAALEAVGFSSRPETETIIQSAFKRGDPAWKTSALIAMGHSSDDAWEEQVISMLLDEDEQIRLAAVEAAGQLNLDSARPILLKLLEDEEDDDVISAAIWSLSEIGGEDVREYLLSLLDGADNDDFVEYVEDALANLDFTEEIERFDFMSLDEEEIDLDEEE